MKQFFAAVLTCMILLSPWGSIHAQDAGNASPAAGSNLFCTDNFALTKIAFTATTNTPSSVPGTPVSFTGVIKNQNGITVPAAELRARVFQIKEDQTFGLVDGYVAAENIVLPAEGEYSFTDEWLVPENQPIGEYAIEYALAFMGETAVVLGYGPRFTVVSENQAVQFDHNTMQINGQPYQNFDQTLLTDDESMTISITVINPTNEDKIIPMQWNQYRGPYPVESSRLDTKTSLLTIAANSEEVISYVTKPTNAKDFLVNVIIDDRGAKSLHDFQFVRAMPDPRVIVAGVSNVPLLANQSVDLFYCIATPATAELASYRLLFDVTDSNGLAVASVARDSVSDASIPTFVPDSNQNAILITSTIEKDGVPVSEETIEYNCAVLSGVCHQELPGNTTLFERIIANALFFYGGAALLVVLLILVWVAYRRQQALRYHIKASDGLGPLLIALLMIGASVVPFTHVNAHPINIGGPDIPPITFDICGGAQGLSTLVIREFGRTCADLGWRPDIRTPLPVMDATAYYAPFFSTFTPYTPGQCAETLGGVMTARYQANCPANPSQPTPPPTLPPSQPPATPPPSTGGVCASSICSTAAPIQTNPTLGQSAQCGPSQTEVGPFGCNYGGFHRPVCDLTPNNCTPPTTPPPTTPPPASGCGGSVYLYGGTCDPSGNPPPVFSCDPGERMVISGAPAAYCLSSPDAIEQYDPGQISCVPHASCAAPPPAAGTCTWSGPEDYGYTDYDFNPGPGTVRFCPATYRNRPQCDPSVSNGASATPGSRACRVGPVADCIGYRPVGPGCALPRVVDLTINGENGPLTVPSGETLSVGWVTEGVSSCTLYGAGLPGGSVALNGSTPVPASAVTTSPETYILNCGGAVDSVVVNVTASNAPPTAPTIVGPVTGDTGITYPFIFTATDPNNDQIQYDVDWNNDGSSEVASLLVNSGTGITGNRSWLTAGAYTFQVRARDTAGATSAWTQHTITVVQSAPATAVLEAQVNGGSWSANDQTIDPGDTINIRWSSTGATTCVGTNFNTGGAISGSGGATPPGPNSATDFSVSCNGTGGPGNDSLRITTRNLPNFNQPSVTYTLSSGYDPVTGIYDSVTVVFQTTNDGGSPTKANAQYQVRFDRGNDGYDQTATGNLGLLNVGQGVNRTEVFNNVAFSGNRVEVTVDSGNAVAETNESDNTRVLDMTIPPPNPNLEITVSRPVVPAGNTVTLNWNTQASYPMNCTVLGPGVGPINFNPSVAGTTGTAPSQPITAKSEFTLRCVEPITNTTFTDIATVEVVGSVEEI